MRARDAGMEVVYEGIRLTPDEIVDAAREQKAHVIGLSVLSGSHHAAGEDVVARMKKAGLDVPVVVGGIIPPEDAAELEESGVAAVYTPKDFELNRIMSDVVRIVERKNGGATSRSLCNVASASANFAGLTGLLIGIHFGGARDFSSAVAASEKYRSQALARLWRMAGMRASLKPSAPLSVTSISTRS